MEPPVKKLRKLLEDCSDSELDDGAGGVRLDSEFSEASPALKINEEYARRFEHNKKREELQQLEARLGKATSLGKRTRDSGNGEKDNSSESDASTSVSDSEEEDEEGALVTETLDSEILATLNAIRSKDPRVYDNNTTFYSEFQEHANAYQLEKREKPMYLRDYHRKNLLGGETEDDGATPKTFAQQQANLKNIIVREMHAAVDHQDLGNEDMDENGGFLIPKSTTTPELVSKADIQLDVKSADKDPEKFLDEFMAAKAWVPTESSRYQPFESDDEEEENRAEAFEEAYNFRFEDPSKVNETLVTHARDTTALLSVRREEQSSRKKRREAERSKKEEEKKEREAEKSRLRKLKMEELEDKIKKIKQNAGLKAADITDETWAHFLDEKWDNQKWEAEMEKRFGHEYYAQMDLDSSDDGDGAKKKQKPRKPTWDDDIDIKDLIPNFENKVPEFSQSDLDLNDDLEANANASESTFKKSRAQEKRDKKRESRKERRLIEGAVDRTLGLEPTLLPGATKKNASYFRYRETSPQSFGLTAKDILMADDSQLNKFVGLKKLAAFRDPEKKRRDKTKMGKKVRLRQWRKDTFGDENGPTFQFSPQKPNESIAGNGDQTTTGKVKIDIREGDSRKGRKRSKKHYA